MATATIPVDVHKGGYWLLKDTNPTSSSRPRS